MIVLLLLGVFFVGLCVVNLLRATAHRRLRTAERLATIDDYGFASASAPAPLPIHAAEVGVAGVASRIGALYERAVGTFREEPLRAELMSAGMYSVSARTLLGYRILAATLPAALILAISSGSPLVIVIGVGMIPAGWMLPLVLVRRRARQRLHEIELRLPDLIDLLVVTIEAGLGFNAALRIAGDQLRGPLSDELRLTLQEQTMGLAMAEALGNLLTRSDTPALRAFVRAMTQGERLGISTGQIMRNLAVDMRKKRRRMAEEQAQKAPIKMLFPLVFLIFPSMFIVLLVPALINLVHTLGSG